VNEGALSKLRESMDSCDSLVQRRIDEVKVPIKDIKHAVQLYLQEQERKKTEIAYKLP
jgi:dsRNA-specific ribonuclease